MNLITLCFYNIHQHSKNSCFHLIFHVKFLGHNHNFSHHNSVNMMWDHLMHECCFIISCFMINSHFIKHLTINSFHTFRKSTFFFITNKILMPTHIIFRIIRANINCTTFLIKCISFWKRYKSLFFSIFCYSITIFIQKFNYSCHGFKMINTIIIYNSSCSF